MDSQPNRSEPWPQPPQFPIPPPIYASQPLDQKALDSIGPGSGPEQWLHDGVVDTFIGRLCRISPGQFRLLLSTTLELVRALRTLELEAAIAQTKSESWEGEEEEEQDEQEVPPAPTEAEIDEAYKDLRIQAATVTGNGGLVFMPFCFGGHWVLAVGDLQYKVIRVYDSLISNSGYPSQEVEYVIVPVAKRILSFCLEEDNWTVEIMRLPIEYNTTECGVYVCMMALQHCCQRRFTPDDYTLLFRSDDGYLLPYHLEKCYWHAARKVILHLCSRFSSSVVAPYSIFLVDKAISSKFQSFYNQSQVQRQVPGYNTYRTARSWTLGRIVNALSWACASMRNLESPQNQEYNAAVQRRTLDVALTRSGEQFRNHIVGEVNDHARHARAEPLVILLHDFQTAMASLEQEHQVAHTRMVNYLGLGAYAQRGLAESPAGQDLRAADSDTCSSFTIGEDPTEQSPGTAQLVLPSESDSEQPEPES